MQRAQRTQGGARANVASVWGQQQPGRAMPRSGVFVPGSSSPPSTFGFPLVEIAAHIATEGPITVTLNSTAMKVRASQL